MSHDGSTDHVISFFSRVLCFLFLGPVAARPSVSNQLGPPNEGTLGPLKTRPVYLVPRIRSTWMVLTRKSSFLPRHSSLLLQREFPLSCPGLCLFKLEWRPVLQDLCFIHSKQRIKPGPDGNKGDVGLDTELGVGGTVVSQTTWVPLGRLLYFHSPPKPLSREKGLPSSLPLFPGGSRHTQDPRVGELKQS